MEVDLRDWLCEMFPNLRFFGEPITDDSIIGVSLIDDDDDGSCWVVVYDEYKVLEELKNNFYKGDDEGAENEALEWYNFNVIDAYIGNTTPVIMHDYELGEYAATRYNTCYDSYVMLDDISSLNEAYNIIKSKDIMLYVPLDQVDQINDYA